MCVSCSLFWSVKSCHYIYETVSTMDTSGAPFTTRIKIKAWISEYIIERWDAITHPGITCNRINTSRKIQNRHHFPDNILQCNFFNENEKFSFKISLKFVQIMAWCQSGDKPLSKPMTNILLTHNFVTLRQWVQLNHPDIRAWISHSHEWKYDKI